MEIGVAQHNCRGESICGDGYVALEQEGLYAVVDGLGHGPQAAEASQIFCEHVKENNDASPLEIMESAFVALRPTRGAVAAIIKIVSTVKKQGTLGFVGVGNIDIHSISQDRIKPVSVPGIVGQRIRKMKLFEYTIHSGDLLIMHTDGVSSRLHPEKYLGMPAQKIADEILAEHGKYYDDATCLVLRY